MEERKDLADGPGGGGGPTEGREMRKTQCTTLAQEAASLKLLQYGGWRWGAHGSRTHMATHPQSNPETEAAPPQGVSHQPDNPGEHGCSCIQ